MTIERQRQAEAQLHQARLLGVASGLELGKEYIDPANPSGGRKSDEPYYSLKPYQREMDKLERLAYPWLYTDAALIRRREIEEARDFRRLERIMGGMKA